MSSFSLQNSQLRAALVAAGLPASHSATIANILGNAAQEMRHSGTLTHDTTPEGMRLVGPDERKHVFPSLDAPQQDPDYRRPQSRQSEERPSIGAQVNVRNTTAPQQIDAALGVVGEVASGSYTTATPLDQAARVDLNLRFDGPCVFADPATNMLRGKGIRAECGGRDDGRVRFWIEERDREAVWRLQLINVKRQDVVTGIQYQPGRGLVVTYQTIDAWAIGDPYKKLVPLPQNNISVSQPIVIGKRLLEEGEPPTAGWEKNNDSSVQPYIDGSPSDEAPIENVRNKWRYIRPDQFVAIAQDVQGDWYVVESEVGCIETGETHAADITREQLEEEASADGIADLKSCPQVLVHHMGCTMWKPVQPVNIPAASTNVHAVRTDGNGGLLTSFMNAYVFPAAQYDTGPEVSIPCSELGITVSAGTFTCSHGTGSISLSGSDCNPVINASLTLNTTDCPEPSPGDP